MIYEILEKEAKLKGYVDKDDLLMDYGIMPSVRVPNHKKWEVVFILLDGIRKKIKKD